MSEIKKLFRRGKCRVCHLEENIRKKNLCLKCESFASQEHVGERESPSTARGIERALMRASDRSVANWRGWFSPAGDPEKLRRAFRTADLTKKQAQVMRLYFMKCLNFSEISRKLGISRDSVVERYDLGLKKLIKHPQILQVVRGKDKKPDPKVKSKSDEAPILLGGVRWQNIPPALRGKPKPTIDPYQYYSTCPQCRLADFHAKENTAKCLNCGWAFRVHTVDEVINSHPYPDDFILAKYFSGPFYSKF
ncbi:MAG: sigma factor-like helix-turn-helix DNA-binding protein [Bdellovibrionia bacterium]